MKTLGPSKEHEFRFRIYYGVIDDFMHGPPKLLITFGNIKTTYRLIIDRIGIELTQTKRGELIYSVLWCHDWRRKRG